MTNARCCPRCGAQLGTGASPAGLCPACLLNVAWADSSASWGDGEGTVTGLSPGATVGPFRIIELLGKGGMASVYKAYEAALDRYVALKILPTEFLHDDAFARRFEREAKLVAKLEHPNIVPIYAGGINDGIPWMSMRLLAGGSLATMLNGESLDLQRAVKILRDVAEALDYAHKIGVIHCDMKPSNILLGPAEQVCVSDFGLAHAVERSVVFTRTGMMAGTPQYMAPEQALGKTVDHRCDIYALGIVAYEMLTGHTPFEADTPVAILMMHVSEPLPVPPPDKVPQPLLLALQKCVAKRPEDRWTSARAFTAAMEEGIAETLRSSPKVFTQSESVWPATTEPETTPAPAGPSGWGAETLVAADRQSVLLPPTERAVSSVKRGDRGLSGARLAAAAVVSLLMLAAIAFSVWRQVPQSGAPERLPIIEAPAVPTTPPATTPTPTAPPPQPADGTQPARGAPVPVVPVASRPVSEAEPPPLQRSPADSAIQSEAQQPPPVADVPPTAPALKTGPDSGNVEAIKGRGSETDRATVDKSTSNAPPSPPTESIREPKKTKHVEPVYPGVARRAGVQGDVIVQASIGADGKVTKVTVVRSIPLLDEAAIKAVLQWEYTPALRDGVPEAAIMNVTVSFRIQ